MLYPYSGHMHLTYKHAPLILWFKSITLIAVKPRNLAWIFRFILFVLAFNWIFPVNHKQKINIHAMLKSNLSNFPEEFYKFRHNCYEWMDFENSQTCKSFKLLNGNPTWTSQEEFEFPLAFTIMVYTDAIQVARLLRLIYRPQNAYCIHIDKKSSESFGQRIETLAKCYGSNVIVVQRDQRVDVRWGYYSNLEPTLICSNLLINMSQIRWRYLLNLNGREFPLLTNWELVKSIKALNGSNVVEALDINPVRERIPNAATSFPVQWIKGSFLTVLIREFVEFTLTNQYAQEIQQILKNESHLEKHPDELFYPTLAYNPHLGAPGACRTVRFVNGSDPGSVFVARYVLWTSKIGSCPSHKHRRGVCLLGLHDLSILINPKLKKFFANKFVCRFHPLAYDFMEIWMMTKILKEKETGAVDGEFDTSVYANLHCSRDHI